MLQMRRRMMIGAKELVVFENGKINPDLGTSVSGDIITQKFGDKGGVIAEYSVNGQWTGIRCLVDASTSAGENGICAFSTANKIFVPRGFKRINAILISRDRYNATPRGCVGLNLWTAGGAYNENNVFSVGAGYADANIVDGAVIALPNSLPEIKTAYSQSNDDSGNLPLYQIGRFSTAEIPAGEYYIGGYIRRIVSYTGGQNGNSMVIKKLWLTE